MTTGKGSLGNKPCPMCRANGHDTKGDHLWIMKDGVTWACFRSSYHTSGKPYVERAGGTFSNRESNSQRETLEDVKEYPYMIQTYRGILPEIYRHFEVRCSFSEETGEIEYLYFPIKVKGELIGFHRRSLKEKTFINIGNTSGRNLDLFGADKCNKTGKSIVIAEGHFDALSIYQTITIKYPKIPGNVVSVNNGLGSLKDIGNARNDLLSYDAILLSFDMDAPGREGVTKVAKMLGSKIKIMELSEKDANDALIKGKTQEIINAFFNPRDYIPSDIVTLSNIYDDILKEVPYGTPFPFDTLNDLTYGIFPRQIISIGAAVGSGKTTFINQLTSYLIREFKYKVGVFSLEETPAYTAKKMIGSLIKKRLHLPGVVATKEEISEVYEQLKNYMYLYDTQGFLSWEDIKNNIRYLASIGCGLFIIDPLTAVTANLSASEANETLNGMMAELSSIVQSLSITVFLISHLNNPKTGKMHSEGGKVSGEQFTQSRAMYRWSHLVLGLERNLQAEDEGEKNTMIVRVIKNRLTGDTGEVVLSYNKESGILEDMGIREIV